MADKKITVLGDAGDDSLTPEEAHTIEVKVDKMLSLEDQGKEDDTAPVPPVATKPAKKIAITVAEADEDEPIVPSAPPLKKPAGKSTGKTPKKTRPAAAAEPVIEPEETPLPTPPGAPALETVPAEETSAADPEPPVEPKKYRPPEGPMPFKRAEPSDIATPVARPGAGITDQPVDDETLAQAFQPDDTETVETKPEPDRSKPRKRGWIVLLLILIILAGLAAAAYLLPDIRQKIIDRINPPPAKTTQQSATVSPVSQPADDIFIARENGTYNVYKITADGQDRKLLLAGTGSEDADSVIVPNAGHSMAALVSVRDTQRDGAGYLLQRLTLIDAATGTPTTITQAQRVYIVGWFGSRLVYVTSKTAAEPSDTSAYQLLSYNLATKQAKELDKANHFNSVANAGGKIYYATSNPGGSSRLQRIAPDGTGKQQLLDKQVFSIYRSTYDELVFVTATSWYQMKLSATAPMVSSSAYDGDGLLYVDAPDNLHSARVGSDGKIYTYDTNTGKETLLATINGATNPVTWLNQRTLVVRIETPDETADYKIDLTDPKPVKITDVSASRGLELWR